MPPRTGCAQAVIKALRSKPSGDGSYDFDCPACGSYARYSPKTGEWHCFACRTAGTGEDLLHRIEQTRASAIAEMPTVEDPWDEPVPFERVAVPSFPCDLLPEPLGAFVRGLAEATQTDSGLAGPLVVAAAAAATSGRFRVRIRPGWEEPTNLYVMTVLASGNRKSPVVEEIVRPLREYERWLAEVEGPGVAEHNSRRKLLEQRGDRATKRAAAAKSAEALAQAEAEAASLARDLAAMPERALPRLLADDCTPEKLAQMLAAQGGSLAIFSAEGGLFDIVAGRYGDRKAPNLDILLKAHTGEPYNSDRISRSSVDVPNPRLTLGLAVQPAVLDGLFANPAFRGRGLIARILFGMPRSLVGFRDADAPPLDDSLRDRYAATIRGLLVLSRPARGDGPVARVVLELDDEARWWLLEFERKLEKRMRPGGDLAHVADWAAKLTGAVVRIAGSCHLAGHVTNGTSWDGPIAAGTVAASITLAEEFLIPHALAAFGQMSADPAAENARAVLDWLKRSGHRSVSVREVYRGIGGRFRGPNDVKPALALLVDHGYLRPHDSLNSPGGGRGRPPSPMYEVHPKVIAQK